MSRISTVLFDADGVLQRGPTGWISHWASLIDSPDRLDDFVQDIFAAEYPHLSGEPGFEAAIQAVLDKWHSDRPLEDAMRLWFMIEPDEDNLSLVRAVRQQGVSVGLATNQHLPRYQYMMSNFGYAEMFDHLFVSCKMGVAKPSLAYFEDIVDQLGCEPGELLFFDDNPDNVAAACEAGLAAETFRIPEGRARLEQLLAQYEVPFGAA